MNILWLSIYSYISLAPRHSFFSIVLEAPCAVLHPNHLTRSHPHISRGSNMLHLLVTVTSRSQSPKYALLLGFKIFNEMVIPCMPPFLIRKSPLLSNIIITYITCICPAGDPRTLLPISIFSMLPSLWSFLLNQTFLGERLYLPDVRKSGDIVVVVVRDRKWPPLWRATKFIWIHMVCEPVSP